MRVTSTTPTPDKPKGAPGIYRHIDTPDYYLIVQSDSENVIVDFRDASPRLISLADIIWSQWLPTDPGFAITFTQD